MTEQDLRAIKEQKITAADMPISMNKATERLNAKIIEWEEHPEHFDGVNPFAIAAYEIRQKTLKWETQELCDDAVSREAAIQQIRKWYFDKELQAAKDDPCVIDAMTDLAIRTIKALPSIQPIQTARVMTLEEAKHQDVVWLEDKNGFIMEPVLVMIGSDLKGDVCLTLTTVYGTVTVPNDKYGVLFRCWTARPTVEQREAVAWK